MRRILMSLTLASTVLIAGCPGPTANTPGEIDIQAASEQQAAQRAAMTQAVQAVAEGKVGNAISGSIEIPVDMATVAPQLEAGAPPVYLHAFRATGEVIREAEISLVTSDQRTYSFIVDKVPDEPIVLAATIEPGIVLRAVVPAASREAPARKQVINTQTEIITQDLARLGVMPHVGTLGLGSVLAQGGLNPAAAAEANEKAAAAYEEFASSEWAQDIPEAKELVSALRNLAENQREAARLLDGNQGVMPPSGIIATGGLNYSVMRAWWCFWCAEEEVEQKRKTTLKKAQEKQKSVPAPPQINSVFNSGEALRQVATHTDIARSAPIIATGGGNIIATGGGNIIATGGLNMRLEANGEIFHGGKLIGQAGGNLIGQAGGNLVMDDHGNLTLNGQKIIATGGGNIISTGGGNIIATGGGNITTTGGGNIISTGGGNLKVDEQGFMSVGGTLIGQAGGNIIATGGGNFSIQKDLSVLDGNGNLIGQAGGNIFAHSGQLLSPAGTMIANLISPANLIPRFGLLSLKEPVRNRLMALEDALQRETQQKVALNGDPFTASEIENFLASGKNPYRTDCSQIDFDPSNTSCRVVVSAKGVQEVMVTRRAKTLEAYISQLRSAWEKDDVQALDKLFAENPALVNFVDHPDHVKWQSPIGTWRLRVMQMRGNDQLGKEFLLVNDSEVTIAQKGQAPTDPLPSGPVAANFSIWFSYGNSLETRDMLNNFAMRFDWEQDGRHLKNGLITGDNRDIDDRSRKLYNATFSGQMQGVTLIEGLWQSDDGQTSGLYQMIRGTERYTIPLKQ